MVSPTHNHNNKKAEPTPASSSEKAALQRALFQETSAGLHERLQRENTASRANALLGQRDGK